MQTINPQIVSGRRVLLRYDIDVALECKVQSAKCKVKEDYKLKAGLKTLDLCLENAHSVIMMGHIGRPSFAEATEGKPDKFFVPKYSVVPIVEWFEKQGYSGDLGSGKLKILENLRFDPREEAGDIDYTKELAEMGDFYVNEAFSAYRPASSTTILPTLLPHAAGLHFVEEVRVLREVRENPKKPFIVIMGGAKVADKLPVINVLAQKADAVLVGGRLVREIREQQPKLPANVLVGKLKEDGFDIAPETLEAWRDLILKAAMIVWNGPLGKFEDPGNDQSAKIAQIILESGAEIVVGGGDTVSLLGGLELLGEYEKKGLPAGRQGFVSVGGGAMLKLISDGTLPSIEVLQ